MTEATESADVVVVGGGGSGLASAVSAAQRGVSVLLVEKQAKVGGTTQLSVGSLTASGTRHQRRAGIHDSAEEFERDMAAFDPALLTGDAPALRRVLATESAATLEWLEALGVAFVGPYLEPPHRTPRMHNVIPASRSYVSRLHEAARRLGVSILEGTAVVELLLEDGSVTGVRVQDPDTGRQREIRARRGVILAAGDFSGNPDMRRQFLPEAAAAALPINETANGDGHRLGISAGGVGRRMEVTFGPQLRFPPAPKPGIIDRLPDWKLLCRAQAALIQRLPTSALKPFVKSLLITHMSPTSAMFEAGAVLVNETGSRFCDERSSVAALSSQPRAKGFIVFDEAIAKKFDTPPHSISTAPGIAFAYFSDYRRGRPDLMFKAASSTEMAQKLAVDPAALAESVDGAGLGRPLHAMGPVFSMLTVTEGGLDVDDCLRVLSASGEPIPGLWAVGGVGQGGMLLKGHGHHIAWAMTSGRLAGAAAARRLEAGSPTATTAATRTA